MTALSLLGRWLGGKLRQTWYVRDAAGTAGEIVTERTALNLSVVWACIRLLCENIGSLPVVLYRDKAGGSATIAKEHPLYPVLFDRPNADFSALEYWEGVIFQLCTRGNSFSEIERRGDGSVVALTLLDPDRVSVRRLSTGEREYRYADRTGSRVIPEDLVFHVRGFGPGDDLGLSPIAFGARSMGVALAAESSAARSFASGGRPAGFFSWGQGEKAPDVQQWAQIRELYFSAEARKDSVGDVMPLPPGATFSSTGLKPDDAQLLETRSFDVEVLCRWFLVQPVMIGHTSKSTSFGAGLEQQNLWFLNRTLRPYLNRITDAIGHKLLRPGERGQYFAQHDTGVLLQTDRLTRSKIYQTMVGAPTLTVNEARAEENLPPVPGGDVLRTQMQNIPIAGGNDNSPGNESGTVREEPA